MDAGKDNNFGSDEWPKDESVSKEVEGTNETTPITVNLSFGLCNVP